MEITPAMLQKIQDEIAKQFAAIGQQHGVEIKFGSSRYAGGNAILKLEVISKAGQ